MSLGNKILELRKKNGLSQEQLGEKVGVTRQTISNWELGETTPNPEQLKHLSSALNISIDELLDNNINNTLVEKISNTEKLAGMIIKILKGIGIAFVAFLIIDIVALIFFVSTGKMDVEGSAITICSIDNKKYRIEYGTNGYFKCDECSDKMKNDLILLTDFNNLDKSMESIEDYFKSNNGTCE